jgi:Tfp pilus assembly protein PilF
MVIAVRVPDNKSCFLPQYTEAVQLVQSAIQLAPSNAKYRHSLGVIHEAAEQWTSAADAFERAVQKRPDDVRVSAQVP